MVCLPFSFLEGNWEECITERWFLPKDPEISKMWDALFHLYGNTQVTPPKLQSLALLVNTAPAGPTITRRGHMLQLTLADLTSCEIGARYHQPQGVGKSGQLAPAPQGLGTVAEALISFRAPGKPGPKRG